MRAVDVKDAFHMLSDFLSADEHYLASSQAYGDLGLKGLNDALDIFLERPELGFVWMAYDEKGVAGICVVVTRFRRRWEQWSPSSTMFQSNPIGAEKESELSWLSS